MTLFDRITCQAMRLGARALAAGRVEMAVTGLDAYPYSWPGPFSRPTLSSSVRRGCAVGFNATSDPYPGDLRLGEKQSRPTLMTLATTMARWPVVLRSDALRAGVDSGREERSISPAPTSGAISAEP